MRDHYQLSQEAYEALLKDNVTVKDLFLSVPLFDPYNKGCEINKMSLLFYVDKKGDFNEGPQFPHKKIAKAVFDRLPIKCKIEVAEYIDHLYGDGEDDE